MNVKNGTQLNTTTLWQNISIDFLEKRSWERGKSWESIACMGKYQPRF